MRRDRLMLAAKILREPRAPDAPKFNMAFWIMKRKTIPPAAPACETAACALGTLALDPRMQSLGLTAQIPSDAVLDEALAIRTRSKRVFGRSDLCVDTSWVSISNTVAYKHAVGYHAAEDFFGIREEEANYLFVPCRYPVPADDISPTMVADRIDELLREDHSDECAANEAGDSDSPCA